MGFRRSWVQIPPARPIKTLKIPPYTSLDLHSGECRGSDRGALWPESLRYGLPAGRVRVIGGAALAHDRTAPEHRARPLSAAQGLVFLGTASDAAKPNLPGHLPLESVRMD